MLDPKDFKLDDESKKFVDGAFMGHTATMFFFTLTTGLEKHSFCTTPEQMKLIQIMIQKNMEIYEANFKKIGAVEIKNAQEGAIVSPIQMDTLGGDDIGDKIK